MTKSTLTRERLEKIKSWRETYATGRNVMLPAEEAEELARMALAAMDSEPVFTLEVARADYKEQKLGNHFGFITLDTARKLEEGKYQLYRHAQPATVVPEEMPCGGAADDYHDGYQDGWNACRAAMLQAQSSDDGEPTDDERIMAIEGIIPPISAGNSPVIPDGSVAMLRRWLAFGRGMQNAGSQLPHNLIAETESMLAAAPTGIPMIPDGYVMVPKAPTGEMQTAGGIAVKCETTALNKLWTANKVYQAMLAAAPQPQNSPQNIPEIIPGWIPVSERMPEREYVLAADFSGKHYSPCQPNTQVGIYADWFNDGNPTWDDGDGNDLHLKQVTHWMPLPATPQEPKP